MRKVYEILVEEPLERTRRRWEEILRKQGGKALTGCICLRIGTSGGLF
jgi:hypothetical protein